MADSLTIALAQLNPVVGDVAGNADLILAARAEAALDGADLVVYTELVLIGYPPEDLVLKPALMDHVETAMATLAEHTADGGPALLIGAPLADRRQQRLPVLRARRAHVHLAHLARRAIPVPHDVHVELAHQPFPRRSAAIPYVWPSPMVLFWK